MKPLVLIILVFLLAAEACQKKSVPVIAERKTRPYRKVFSTYSPPGSVAADTVAGKMIFMARCNRCHAIPEPQQYTSSRWEVILEGMLPKAGIEKENRVHVRAYLLANAKK
jgi:cytochrome c5